MITISGRTYDHREMLKSIPGKQWDADRKLWKFDYIAPGLLERLRKTIGLVVAEVDDDEDDELPDIDSIIAALGFGDSRPVIGTQPATVYGDDQRYLNYFKDQNPLAFFGFSSLGAMTDYVERIPPHQRTGERDAGFERGTWHGTPDMAAALALARNGWPEGVDNALEIVELLTVPHAVQRRRQYNVAGNTVNVGRMLAGNPEHMVRRPKLPGKKIITLFAETSAAAVIKVENLIARASIIAAIADILEDNGYSCEIVALENNRNSNKPGSQTAVTIKHAGEKLNLNDAVFALGHPSFHRRFNFACSCSSDECRPIWSTQGMATHGFDKAHPTKQNEFYIKPLMVMQQSAIVEGSLRERALSMLEFVKPDNLPIEITGEF